MRSYVVSKMSNHGASHPIVARLSIQTLDMLQWINITDQSKQDLVSTIIDELQPKLLQCSDIYVRLLTAKDASLADATAILESGGQTLPHLIGLREESEAFLNAAKQYVRDLSLLINQLFGANLAREAKVFWEQKGNAPGPAASVWAASELDDDFAQWLSDQRGWIGELCKKRNAVEHPEKMSGTLKINNFQHHQGNQFLPPSWKRVGKNVRCDETDLLGDVGVYLDSLLRFTEEIIASAVKLRPTFPPIEIFEIEESQRKPEAPVRLKASVDLAKFKRKPPKITKGPDPH